MKIVKTYFEILPVHQKEYWNKMGAIKDIGFILYGGTAIALQIGHRKSVDFDFFLDSSFDLMSMSNQIIKICPFLEDAEQAPVKVLRDNTLRFITPTGVEFSFFGGINFGRVGEPVQTEDTILTLASLDDLLALKLATILQRIEYKDYKDIATLLGNGMSLEKGLNDASALYGDMFFPFDSVQALTYFQSKELVLLEDSDKKKLVDAVKNLRLEKLTPNSRLSDSLQPQLETQIEKKQTEKTKTKRMKM